MQYSRAISIEMYEVIYILSIIEIHFIALAIRID